MVFDDISSRKQLAEQRRKSEQLELVNRIVERIAHGIKNPLVSIRTFLELYEERFDDKSFREELGPSARRDLERLNGLLEQLTAVTAPRQYHFELADINELLEEYIALLHEESEAKSWEVVTDFAEEIPPVKCDKEYLKQALGYLMRYLINTMEKPGTLKVVSSMRKDSNGMDAIHITMTSNVSKISQQEREKLFDPLAVVQDADIDLGPCASQRIIEEHGGYIKLQTKKATGVGFVIYIPPAPE
jgi:nitrogen-specific signal transduction histidine kinase